MYFLQVSMGSLKEHFQAKNEARKAAGLPEWPEDTVEVCRKIRASSPPALGTEFLENRRRPANVSKLVIIIL